MRFQFSPRYAALTVLLFCIEVLIATKLRHFPFIRGSLGDAIVVILVYCFVRSFAVVDHRKLVAGVFAFACLVEFSQYFHLAEWLGFQRGSVMYIVMGNSFSWSDILCYAAGCALLLCVVRQKPGAAPR